jgi:hypothetical protein
MPTDSGAKTHISQRQWTIKEGSMDAPAFASFGHTIAREQTSAFGAQYHGETLMNMPVVYGTYRTNTGQNPEQS